MPYTSRNYKLYIWFSWNASVSVCFISYVSVMKLNIYDRNSFADINSSVKSVCFAFLVKTVKDIAHFARIST